MTDDLRDKIANRLGQAWPDLTEDPVYLDQLAAQAMTVVGPEVAALRAENAYRLRRDEYIVAERDVLKAEVKRMQAEVRRIADRIVSMPLNGDRFTLTAIRQVADALRALAALDSTETPDNA